MSGAESGGAQAPLTFKAAREIVRGLGLTIIKSAWGDYRVTDPTNPSRAERDRFAYYTDDLGDAVDTARQMAKGRVIE